jgi:uncharacterized protein (DUF849 family)
MPLTMNREVFITCAVTGSGGTQDRSPHVPRSPAQIADSAIAAAKAGAAVVHCHVRDPETGKPARDPALYREVTERIRDSATDVVLNLTAGMGGDMLFDGTESMNRMSPAVRHGGCDRTGAHVVECRPEICTLDCGTMNFAEADYVMVNTPGLLRDMARAWSRPARGSRSRPSIPGICGLPSNWRRRRSSPTPCWCNCAWACRGARRMT